MSTDPAEPQEPGSTSQEPTQIEQIREFMRKRLEERSLREVAGEVGIGKDAVRSFAQGQGEPYSRTEQKVREWYVREVLVAPPTRPIPGYHDLRRRRAPAPRQAPRQPTPAPAELTRLRLSSARRVFATDAELADALGVDRAQPARWRAGQAPDPSNREKLVALDTVIELLSTYLSPTSIPKWLNGVNAHLGNRRPLQVLRSGHLSEVVAAIEAEKSGAYA